MIEKPFYETNMPYKELGFFHGCSTSLNRGIVWLVWCMNLESPYKKECLFFLFFLNKKDKMARPFTLSFQESAPHLM